MSLQAALGELGFGPCYHMTEIFAHPGHADFWISAWRGEFVNWDGVIGGYEATVDWPGCTFYEELMERYPEAKVLLSVREPEPWYESTRNTVYEMSMLLDSSRMSRLIFGLITLLVYGGFAGDRSDLVNDLVWEGTFDGSFEDKAYAIEVFRRHNEEVERCVPSERLLVYDVKEGWGPLCEFLGVPEPEEPFPHRNDAAQMRRGIKAVRALVTAMPVALLVLLFALLVLL